ncbi:MAG: dienelactone hydrolase family protein [Solirubrobacterales bacterium]
MADVAIFPSILGVRRGVVRAGEILRFRGHQVTIVDLYDGWIFDDYREAFDFAESRGRERLMEKAVREVRHLPDGFIAAGFSMGAGVAQHIAGRRDVSSVLMFSGAASLEAAGLGAWPEGVGGQIHYMDSDPYRNPGAVEEVAAAIDAAGAVVDVYAYEGDGHLFTDSSLPDEYDARAAEIFWRRVLDHCAGYRLSAA